jgi:hypothetical protein
MTDNTEQATEIVVNKTAAENGEDSKQGSHENGTINQHFGVVDLWRIRRSARTFRIHNRIPRI